MAQRLFKTLGNMPPVDYSLAAPPAAMPPVDPGAVPTGVPDAAPSGVPLPQRGAAPPPDPWINPHDAEIAAQVERMNAMRTQKKPIYSPEEVEERRGQNRDEYELGLLGVISGHSGLQKAGGTVLQNALANRKRTVTERGSSDPLTGEFTYDPDYEISQEQTKLDTLHKLKTAADLRHDADMRDAALRRELQGMRDEAAAERAALVGAGKGGIGAETGRLYSVEDRMADDFNREVGKQQKVIANYGNLKRLASMGTPMSDVALVFNYMKVLDPESVVRSDEQAQVSNAAGVPERVRNLWNSVFSGVRLSEKQRQEVLAAAGAYAETAEAHISGATRSYNDRAKRRGLSTLQVTGTPDDDMPPTPAPRARGGAAPAPAAPGKKAPVRVNY